MFLRPLSITFFLTTYFSGCVSATIIRQILLKVSALERADENTDRRLGEKTERIAALEHVVMQLLEKDTKRRQQIELLQGQLETFLTTTLPQTTMPTTTTNPDDRFLYELIEREKLSNIRKLSEQNPNQPIILHLSNGRIQHLEPTTTTQPEKDPNLEILEMLKDEHRESFDELSSRIDGLANKTENIERRMSQIYDFSVSTSGEVGSTDGSGMDSELLTLETGLVGHESDLLDLRQKIDSITAHLDEIDAQLRSDQSELSAANSTLAEFAEAITTLEGNFSSVKDNLNNFSVALVESRCELTEFKTTLESGIEILNRTAREQHAEYGTRTSELSREIEKGRGIIASAQKAQGRYFTQIQQYGLKLHEIETQVLNYGLKLSSLSNQFLEEILQRAKDNNADITQDLAIRDLEKSLHDIRTEDKDRDSKINNLKNLIAKCAEDGAIQELAGKAGDFNKYLSSHRDYILYLNRTAVETKASLSRLESTLPHSCVQGGSEIQLIKPQPHFSSFHVLCREAYNRTWAIVQRRTSSATNFNRTYAEYEKGFGNLTGNFWLGNSQIHALANRQNPACMYVRMKDIYGETYTAFYKASIRNAEAGYALSIHEFEGGNATDALAEHSGMRFSAYDHDQDVASTHCAKFHLSGWWFAHCQQANLNGPYDIGVLWFHGGKDTFLQLTHTLVGMAEEACPKGV